VTFLIKESGYREAVLTLHRDGKLRKLDPGRITNDESRFAVKAEKGS